MHAKDHWTEQVHRMLIGITDFVNRIDIDARLLAASDVKLDRALFPLLSRLGLHPAITTVELANLIGRDHSTVSRQIAKLTELGLVDRTPDPRDARARLLAPTPQGYDLLARIAKVRRGWIEDHFADWPDNDRDTLIRLMTRLMEGRWPIAGLGQQVEADTMKEKQA